MLEGDNRRASLGCLVRHQPTARFAACAEVAFGIGVGECNEAVRADLANSGPLGKGCRQPIGVLIVIARHDQQRRIAEG